MDAGTKTNIKMAAVTRSFLQKFPKCFCKNLRSASTAAPYSYLRHEDVTHCSNLRENTQYNSEIRGVWIQHGVEHLKSLENIRIKNVVKQISINDQLNSKGMDEKSLFLYDKIPPLKFSNPDVSIVCTRDETKPWDIAIQLENGEELNVDVDGKTSHEIFIEFCNLIAEETT
ncbi:uncharacterized protein [Clytia hemisphaerica]|uniref:Ribosomal protein/NADH dehydrogenase domain-containing protein n=1 Tax=Clytia hemisphaerica TaxID=252671 RepID=A0A7M6DMJ8_9CNID|eukprot:TCONS_00012101-protein